MQYLPLFWRQRKGRIEKGGVILLLNTWRGLIYYDTETHKSLNRLSLADTDFLFCFMIFLHLNISKDLWVFIALLLWLPVPGNWQSQAVTWSRYSCTYPVIGIFLHESQKSSGFSSIKHSKAQGFGHDIEPPSENWFFCSEMVKLKKLTEELENNYSKLCHWNRNLLLLLWVSLLLCFPQW